MIIYMPPGSDMFENDKAEALVNPTNTKGLAGGGIAAICACKFPLQSKEYFYSCSWRAIVPGRVTYSILGDHHGFRILFFFATMEWGKAATLDTIKTGMKELVRLINILEIKSIVIPPLGCGIGGLNWSDVKPIIINSLSEIENNVDIYIYEQ